ncbi:MAG: FAD:protein FMN transferase [Wenzhouxiangella sp.]
MKSFSGRARASLTILAIILLASCQRADVEQRAEFLVFGTQVQVVVRDLTEVQAEIVFARLGHDFQRMHNEWHPWDPGPLNDLNQGLAEGGWVSTTPDLITLIEASQTLEQRSDGLFNAAIGALVRRWGFHTSRYPITEPPPDETEIQTLLLRQPSTLDIQIDGQRVRSTNRAVHLDFGGIAKGLAARQACERLAEYQSVDAMIDLGGDVMICGPTTKPWRVALSDGRRGVLTTVEIAERMAIFTSGNYYRYGDFNGQRHAHILDPNTGRPVGEVMQATAIDPDPLTADAAATALVVAGPLLWQSVARNMGAEHALIIDSDGNVQATEELAATIENQKVKGD